MSRSSLYRVASLLLSLSLARCAANDLPEREADSPEALFEDRGLVGSSVRPADADSRGDFVELRADETLPAKIDLRRFDGRIRDQGERGTCSAFASLALFESLANMRLATVNPNARFDLSEQDLYYHALDISWIFGAHVYGPSDGQWIETTLRKLALYGAVPETAWPYEARNWMQDGLNGCDASMPSTLSSLCFTNGRPPREVSPSDKGYLVGQRELNLDVDNLRAYLAKNGRPVAATFNFYPRAWSAKGSDGVYRDTHAIALPTGELGDAPSAHAMLIVGYDDDASLVRNDSRGAPTRQRDTGAFIVRNSWGTSWGGSSGDGGYGRVSYAYARECLAEAFSAETVRLYGEQ